MKEFIKEIVKDLFSKIDPIKFAVAFCVMYVFITLVNKLITEEIPKENREIIIHLIGMVEGVVATLVSFYFGSSKGSQSKDKLLADNQTKDKAA
jgi:uncharacterized membrane protein